MSESQKTLESLLADAKVRRHQAESEIAVLTEALGKLNAANPTLNGLKQEAASRRNGTTTPVSRERKTRNGTLTHYEQMLDYFLDRNNAPATVREIAATMGVHQHSVNNVLYTSYKEHFESKFLEEFKRRRAWYLKQDIYDRAMRFAANS